MDHVSAECRMVEAHNERHSMHRAFAAIPQLLHPVLVILRAASASERFSHPQTRLKTITAAMLESPCFTFVISPFTREQPGIDAHRVTRSRNESDSR